MVENTLRSGILVLMFGFAWAVPHTARAQATGSVTGILTDQSGALLPGATIDVVNLATNQRRSAVTGADGWYTVALVPPGQYRVTGTLPGFQTTALDRVSVNVESAARVDLRLEIAGIAETVTTRGRSPAVALIDLMSTTLGLVVGMTEVDELPLNGRNFTQLGTLLPGVMAAPSALGGAAGDATPGGFGAVTSGFSVNGQRNQSNNFLLDGANNNDTFNTGFVLRPPPDAIQEFKILTHSYTAEYGRGSGSVVNVVTRSGSNTLHGAAWEFNRDDALQARNYFAPLEQAKPTLTQHQFGGSLGGPLRRDRMFAFGYYEGHRHTSGLTQNFVVLSDAQRTGDFSAGAAIRDPRTGLPFDGNRIPASRIDPAARQLIDRFLPRANAGPNRHIVSPAVVDDRDQFGLRIDYPLTRHQILGRYMISRTDRHEPPTTRPIGTVSKATLQDVVLSDTHSLSSTLVHVARVAYNRIGATPAATSGLSNASYSIDVPHNLPAAQGLANIAVNGFFNLGDAQQPFVDRLNETVQVTDDINWFTGGHAMKFGLDVRRERMVIGFVNRPNGDFTFDGTQTGNAAADFLLGLPGQFRRATANGNQDGVGWSYAAYVQDQLRPWSNTTLNIGLRYELSRPFVDRRDALNTFRPGQQSQRFARAPLGLVYPGDPGVPRGTYQTDKNNVAPRLGVSWDPWGNGTTSLRASWGLFYDALAGQGDFFQNGVLAPPFTPVLEVNAPPASLTLRNPSAAVAGSAADFPPGLIFIGWSENFRTPLAHHFNVTWQRESLRGRLGTEVGYVGSRGDNLPIFMEVNPGLYTAGQSTRGARVFPAFGLVRPTFSVARSWYDSLQASLRVRATHGISLLASYTLGHAVDHVSGLNIGGEQRPVSPVTIGDDASIQRALALEKGDALFDVRHRFVVSLGADLPAPARAGTAIRQLLSGWRVNGIIQAQSGFPATVYDPTNSIRYLTNRPNQRCDPNDRAPHTVAQWFNTACFEQRPLSATAEPGSTARGVVRGPGFARTDLSLFRTIGLSERHRVQFRVEAFNVWNQTQFRQPDVRIGTPTFGSITAAEDGRIVQLAVKYSF